MNRDKPEFRKTLNGKTLEDPSLHKNGRGACQLSKMEDYTAMMNILRDVG